MNRVTSPTLQKYSYLWSIFTFFHILTPNYKIFSWIRCDRSTRSNYVLPFWSNLVSFCFLQDLLNGRKKKIGKKSHAFVVMIEIHSWQSWRKRSRKTQLVETWPRKLIVRKSGSNSDGVKISRNNKTKQLKYWRGEESNINTKWDQSEEAGSKEKEKTKHMEPNHKSKATKPRRKTQESKPECIERKETWHNSVW